MQEFLELAKKLWKQKSKKKDKKELPLGTKPRPLLFCGFENKVSTRKITKETKIRKKRMITKVRKKRMIQSIEQRISARTRMTHSYV